MPSALNNTLYPVAYQPWYVYRVTLVANPTAFDKYDVLVPTAGRFNRAADDQVLQGGYVVALEQFQTGMTELQVAAAGSVIPSVAAGAIQPGALVKVDVDGTEGMRVVTAVAADIGTGKVLGRFRNHVEDHINNRAAAEGDIIHILTGAI